MLGTRAKVHKDLPRGNVAEATCAREVTAIAAKGSAARREEPSAGAAGHRLRGDLRRDVPKGAASALDAEGLDRDRAASHELRREEPSGYGEPRPTAGEQAMDTQALQAQLRKFARDRDWGRFHDPKNLTMALAAEAGELLEVFQWLTPDEAAALPTSSTSLARATEEVADIAIYLLMLSDALGLDLDAAIGEKIAANAARYPVEATRGSAEKRPKRTE